MGASKWTLDTKTKSVALIIDPSKAKGHVGNVPIEYLNALDLWLSENTENYAYAVHDLDTLEDGTPKTPHVHVWAKLNACTRLGTTLNKVADALNIDTAPITIEKASSMEGSIQYMVHKNNPDKYQYHKSVIRCSFPEKELDGILEADAGCLSLTHLVSVCASSRNLVQVIEALGLGVYQRNRNVVRDIWNDIHLIRSR